ncbi:MAG TPA: alpha-ketoglutarate-dependent dioxygenase AlkB, partial [Bryobacteraceae bacterium]|nr:alpha-ketoglutarate-dependent dioxygenase AlkB [Bryobacteraceae bacterium]
MKTTHDTATGDLLGEITAPADAVEPLAEGACLLRRFASEGAALMDALARVLETAPFRHMVTPGGYAMSVAMTNCGAAGWVTDRRGYRYDPINPATGERWPAMP